MKKNRNHVSKATRQSSRYNHAQAINMRQTMAPGAYAQVYDMQQRKTVENVFSMLNAKLAFLKNLKKNRNRGD